MNANLGRPDSASDHDLEAFAQHVVNVITFDDGSNVWVRRNQMSADEFKAIRQAAQMTQSELAAYLQVSSWRTVARYEAGDHSISGPIAKLMDLLSQKKAKKR